MRLPRLHKESGAGGNSRAAGGVGFWRIEGRVSISRENAKMGKSLPSIEKGVGKTMPLEPASLAFVGGVSASMRPVEAVIRELAQSDVPVLVLAETGRRQACHRTTHSPDVATKYATFSLFSVFRSQGQRPGSSAGAGEPGAQPNAGTIYLEELADLSPECQARLLEALPESPGKGMAGGERARLICGSARDLEVEVKRGRLREDLYYRISGVCLRLPPLRQRKEDIAFLMGHFLRKYARDFRRSVPDLSAETLRLFLDYSWPGNLQELEDAARVLVAMGDEHVALEGLRARLRRPEAGSNGPGISLKAASRAASREAEKELILTTLTRTRWNRRRAAAELQISYKALLYKLKQIGFEGYGAS